MSQNQEPNQQTDEEPDVTMVDSGEKNAGEDPDLSEFEPEVQPDDPDIQGEDASGQPS